MASLLFITINIANIEFVLFIIYSIDYIFLKLQLVDLPLDFKIAKEFLSTADAELPDASRQEDSTASSSPKQTLLSFGYLLTITCSKAATPALDASAGDFKHSTEILDTASFNVVADNPFSADG